MRTRKALVFDMDDTIYDMTQPFERAIEEIGYNLGEIDHYALFRAFRRHSDENYERYLFGEITLPELGAIRICRAFAEYGLSLTDEEGRHFQEVYEGCQSRLSFTEEMKKFLEECRKADGRKPDAASLVEADGKKSDAASLVEADGKKSDVSSLVEGDGKKPVALLARSEELTEDAKTQGVGKETNRILLGVITNGVSRSQWNKIRALGVADWMEEKCILVSGDLDIHKPDVRIFRKMEEVLGVEPSDCIYVGDSYEKDVEGAKAAGWQSVWVNRRRKPCPEAVNRADYTVYTEEEMLECLRGILLQ